MASLQVNDVVLHAVRTAERQHPELGTRTELRLEFGILPAIQADEEGLHTAVVELLLKALRAAPATLGIITVTTEPTPEGVLIGVEDNGAEAVQDRSELELEQTRAVAQQHGGTLEVVATPARGTEVRLRLPRTQVAAVSQKPAGLRILVVDDEPLVREIIEIYLAEDQHEIEFAMHGQDGLEKFQAGVFDLVLTDQSMPMMTGEELAVALKALQPSLPVLLLTGYGELMGAGKLPPGIDGIVSKPFNLAALRRAITTVRRV